MKISSKFVIKIICYEEKTEKSEQPNRILMETLTKRLCIKEI